MANDLDIFSPNSKLPTFLQGTDAKAMNAGMTEHLSLSYPVMSLEGKKFTVVSNGQRQVLMDPHNGRSTLQQLNCVIVMVPKATSKSYYKGIYNGQTQDEEANAPVCFSVTGITPAKGARNPQCNYCKLCQYNQFGSAIDAQGNHGKGKACRDSIRLAIAARDDLDNVMLLRVPPTSIKELGAYGGRLSDKGIPYCAVVTEISFDPTSTAQKLVFTPVEFLTEEEYKYALEVGKRDIVKAITGLTDEEVAWSANAAKRLEAGRAEEPQAVAATLATGNITKEAVEETIKTAKVEKTTETNITTADDLGGADLLGDKWDD